MKKRRRKIPLPRWLLALGAAFSVCDAGWAVAPHGSLLCDSGAAILKDMKGISEVSAPKLVVGPLPKDGPKGADVKCHYSVHMPDGTEYSADFASIITRYLELKKEMKRDKSWKWGN